MWLAILDAEGGFGGFAGHGMDPPLSAAKVVHIEIASWPLVLSQPKGPSTQDYEG